MQYGDSLGADSRKEGTVEVYGSNGPVGVHDAANTYGPVVVVGRKGSHGKLQWSASPAFTIDTTYFIDESCTDADLRWLYFALQTAELETLSQDVGVPGLSREQAYSQRIPLPSLDEQRAIADFLDAETARIDALIAKKRKLAGLMRQRFRVRADGFLEGVSDLVPVRRLISRLTSGPRGWASHVADGGAAFLTIANVRRDDVELNLDNIVRVTAPDNAEARRTRVREGDVLLSITADIGSVGVVRNGLGETYVSQHLALMTPDRCLPDWLAFALWCSATQRQLDSARYGGTKTQLALEDVANVRVPWPARGEQIRLVQILRDARRRHLEVLEKLRHQIELLAEHRQALITAAVTGQLEVPGGAAGLGGVETAAFERRGDL